MLMLWYYNKTSWSKQKVYKYREESYLRTCATYMHVPSKTYLDKYVLGALSLEKEKLLFHSFDRKFPPEKLSKLVLLDNVESAMKQWY